MKSERIMLRMSDGSFEYIVDSPCKILWLDDRVVEVFLATIKGRTPPAHPRWDRDIDLLRRCVEVIEPKESYAVTKRIIEKLDRTLREILEISLGDE